MSSISIIIPIHNIAAYLPPCLDSVRAQTHSALEIILVDDGSTDGCAEICDVYARKDSRIRVIHKENGGLVSARKAGLRAATSDIIAYVDGDDWIEPDMMQKMCDVMMREDVDIVLCDRYEDTGLTAKEIRQGIPAGRYDKEALIRDVYPHMIVGDLFFEWNVFSNVWDKLFRRRVLEAFQMGVPEDVVMGEDALCAYPALLKAESIYMLHEPLYHYRQSAASMVKWRPDKETERHRFQRLYQTGVSVFESQKSIYDLRPQWTDFMLFLMTARADNLYDGIENLPYLFPYPGVKKGSGIILYGAGTYGQRMYQYLRESRFCTVKALVDRNFAELNKQGIPAIAPDEMDGISCDAIVISVQFYHARHEIFGELSKRFPKEMLHLIDESVIKSDATRKAFRLCGETVIKQLQRDLKEYEKVYLVTGEFPGDGDLAGSVFRLVRESVTASEKECRILLLSSAGTGESSSPSVSFRKITTEEEKDLIRLYHMYEFSDRFRLILFTEQYGGLSNYVETGILTKEEMIRALLKTTN